MSTPSPDDHDGLWSYDEAIEFLHTHTDLEKSRWFSAQDMGKRLGSLRRYLELADNPEKKYRTIHVAGTKGKGSTCAMLGAILREMGFRVGLFTSPHLYTPLERLTINGELCSEEDFAYHIRIIKSRLENFMPDLLETITYFELTTLAAFEYFARQHVDFAIFEVGLGGRWDATNLCSPELTLITSISFDHLEQLGPNLADIAAEKGGIIKPGVPLLSTVRRTEAQSVLRKIALSQKAPALFLGEAFFVHPSRLPNVPSQAFRFQTEGNIFSSKLRIEPLTVALPGSHQIRNAALAIAATLLLLQRGPHRHDARQPADQAGIDQNAIARGLRRVSLPIRVEIFPGATNSSRPAPHFVVDGAHNRSSLRALIKTLHENFPESRLLLVFGISLGKDVEGMLADIAQHFDQLFLTQHSSHPRRFPPQGLKTILSSVPDAPHEIWEEFRGITQQDSDCINSEDSVYLSLNIPVPLDADRSRELETSHPSPLTCVEVYESSTEALEKCWNAAAPGDVVCVTGSMFLAAELRQYFLEHLATPK